MQTLWQDLRYGVRMLLRKPGFTLIAVITLALGIGANTAIFSVVKAALLNPLPYRNPEQLVMLWENDTQEGNDRNNVAPANYADWKQQNEVCSELAFYGQPGGINVTGSGEPERIMGAGVAGNIFTLLGVAPFVGRNFTPVPEKGNPAPEVIISFGLWQRRYGGEAAAVGQTITLEGRPFTVAGVMPPQFRLPEESEIIAGVAGDARNFGLDADARPEVHIPYQQNPDQRMRLVVRAEVAPHSLTPAVREAVRAVDRDLPPAQVMTLEELLGKSVAQRQLNMWLLGVFAALALGLAALGIYGVMSYSVTQRTHEIGVRMALGAQTGAVLKLVVKQGMTLALIGLGAGLIASLALTRLMKGLLFGVGATDPLTFVTITLLLTGVALVACWIPARRAAKVDPMIALRCD